MESDVRRFFRGEWKVSDEVFAIVGYLAAESKSEIIRTPSGKPFREIIEAGALRTNGTPVYEEHDPNKEIASAVNISSDPRGWMFKFFPPKDSFGREVLTQVKAGELRVSPGFNVTRDSWSYDDDGTPLRRIHEAELIEFSLVRHPAYPATSSCAIEQRNLEALARRAVRVLDGLIVTEEDKPKSIYIGGS